MNERRSQTGPKGSVDAGRRMAEVRAADEVRAENARLDAALLTEAEGFDPQRLTAAPQGEWSAAQVMAHLGIPPGRAVGEALAMLLEARLDEGPLGEEEAHRRLDAWWAAQGD